MTTKVSNLQRKGFGLQPVSNVVPKPARIIIEFLPGDSQGRSTLRAEGGLTQVAVTLALSAHLNTLLPTMISGLFQSASGVVRPDGTPVLNPPPVPNTLEVQTEEPQEEQVQE